MYTPSLGHDSFWGHQRRGRRYASPEGV